ncbi:MAG: hypothetical protein RBJ76_28485 [Stenomitos frigidus ULC029]
MAKSQNQRTVTESIPIALIRLAVLPRKTASSIGCTGVISLLLDAIPDTV